MRYHRQCIKTWLLPVFDPPLDALHVVAHFPGEGCKTASMAFAKETDIIRKDVFRRAKYGLTLAEQMFSLFGHERHKIMWQAFVYGRASGRRV